MPYAQAADKFNMYTPQGSRRTTFSHFRDVGIDLFSTPGAQNSNGFLQLENVMPSVSGGFNRRWGTQSQSTLSTFATVVRMFPYQVSAEGAVDDVFYSGFSNYYSILATDNTKIEAIFNEGTNDSQAITGFSGTGDVFASVSRDFLYAFDGVGTPQKKHFAKGDAQTNNGFIAPVIVSLDSVVGVGSGYNPGTTTAAVGGGGSGASVSLTFDNGTVTGGSVTSAGSGYGNGTVFITITDTSGGGSGAFLIGTVQDGLTGVFVDGPISTIAGRRYAFAYQNSKTGHTSDVTLANSAVITGEPTVVGGFSIISTLVIATTPPDTQIDTLVIMATADGGDTEHLYEVQVFPLTVFTPVGGGNSTFTFTDQLPDTYTDLISSGNTLLEANLWVDTDSNGNTVGILNNTPPTTDLNKPCPHQGRLFTTNGKTVFFSKSLAEVTTSTGLITSKWEEAWPANNRLDIGFNNEIITGLLSDTTFLYIGTTQNIYRLSGTDIDSFDLQCIFRNVGLQGQDFWTVVFKENLPAGYVWTTPDNKIIFSDFNNYEDIGTPIYPNLTSLDDVVQGVQPWSFGPYTMAFLRTDDEFWVLNLKSNGWYKWTPVGLGTGPILTYVRSNGLSNLFFIVGGGTPQLGFFQPGSAVDAFPTASTNIPWVIQTGWQDMEDTTNLKVINELEIWSQDTNLSTSVISRTGSGSTVTNSVQTQAAPISALQNCLKAYYAAKATAGKFFSFIIQSTISSSQDVVLDQVVVEHFPFGRF